MSKTNNAKEIFKLIGEFVRKYESQTGKSLLEELTGDKAQESMKDQSWRKKAMPKTKELKHRR